MVSFDVVPVFTKVPIQLALSIAKQHLQSNPELSQRTNLSATELNQGLEFCLSSINLLFVENTINRFLEQRFMVLPFHQ